MPGTPWLLEKLAFQMRRLGNVMEWFLAPGRPTGGHRRFFPGLCPLMVPDGGLAKALAPSKGSIRAAAEEIVRVVTGFHGGAFVDALAAFAWADPDIWLVERAAG